MDMFPANTRLLYNICTMLDQRQRRWADVVQMLYKSFVFVGLFVSKTMHKYISYYVPRMTDGRFPSSQMRADSICLTTMGVLEFGGHRVRGSCQSACLKPRKHIQSVMVLGCIGRARGMLCARVVCDAAP